MAKVDPKEILLRNKSLVIVYVLALLPLALWVPVIGSVKGGPKAAPKEKPTDNFAAAQRALKAAEATTKDYVDRIKGGEGKEPLYTSTDVERLGVRRQLYQTQLGALGQIVHEADAELETWFEKFKLTPAGSEPRASDYQTEFANQIALLTEEYKPFVTGDAAESYVFAEQPPANDMRKFQKRFWLQKAVLEALREASKATGWTPEMQKELEKPENVGRAHGMVRPIRLGARIEFPAPPQAMGATKPPVEPIPATLMIDCQLPRLPFVIRELLARKIPIRIVSAKVEKQPFLFRYSQPPGIRFEVPGQEGTFEQEWYGYPGNFPDPAMYTGVQEHWIPEPAARVEVRIEAFDFNKIEVAAPPPPEGETPEEGK